MARPGPGLSGAAEAALLRRHGHPVLSIAAALAAGAALVVVAAGWRRVLVCWAALELLFYLYQRRRYAVLNAEPVEGAAVGAERGDLLMQRLLELKGVMSVQDFFSGWFLGAPFESLKRGNILDFIAYGFHCCRVEELAPEVRERLDAYVRRVEETWGVRFEEGRTPGLRFMAHLWEDLNFLWKPLAVHLAAEGMGLATSVLLLALGFRRHRKQGFAYWVRAPRARAWPRGARSSADGSSSSASAPASPPGSPPDSRPPSPRPGAGGGVPPTEAALGAARAAAGAAPLFFLHGVGLGLTPYMHFIAEMLRALPGRPVVLLEVRAVSVSLTRRPVAADAVAAAAAGVLARHGWPRAAFVGHSYGTFVCSRLAQTRPALVQSLVLIDPVAMLTIYPQLLHNFVYRAFHPADGLIDSLRYAFSRDLVISAVFGRKFVWHQMCLWPHELPDACLVVLSAGDDLVPTPLIIAQLKQHGSPAQVLCHPSAAHGGFLLHGKFRRQVLHAMARTLDAGAALDAQRA